MISVGRRRNHLFPKSLNAFSKPLEILKEFMNFRQSTKKSILFPCPLSHVPCLLSPVDDQWSMINDQWFDHWSSFIIIDNTMKKYEKWPEKIPWVEKSLFLGQFFTPATMAILILLKSCLNYQKRRFSIRKKKKKKRIKKSLTSSSHRMLFERYVHLSRWPQVWRLLCEWPPRRYGRFSLARWKRLPWWIVFLDFF